MGSLGLSRTATFVAPGTISFRISSLLPASSAPIFVTARDIPARSCQTSNEPRAHLVCDRHHDDRRCEVAAFAARTPGVVATSRDIGIEAEQFSGERWSSSSLPSAKRPSMEKFVPSMYSEIARSTAECRDIESRRAPSSGLPVRYPTRFRLSPTAALTPQRAGHRRAREGGDSSPLLSVITRDSGPRSAGRRCRPWRAAPPPRRCRVSVTVWYLRSWSRS